MAKTPKLKARKLPPCGPVDVPAVWARIEACLKALAPDLLGNLAPGATDARIIAFEGAIGRTLPEEVRASFRTHNGQVHRAYQHPVINSIAFGSLAWASEQWDVWLGLEGIDDLEEAAREDGSSTPEGAINLGYANRNWVQLVATGDSDYFGLDFAPGPKGLPGQIINFGRDEEQKAVWAWSWGWFLNDLAEELERGNFRPPAQGEDPGLYLIDPEPPYGNFFNLSREWSKAKTAGRRPFDPLTTEALEPLRADAAVMNLARSIAESKDFSSLPVLADALEEAGCTDKKFLMHCREPGEHGCGCWAVNLLLGAAPEFERAQ
jgi:cell wall assembly regulator SMI1